MHDELFKYSVLSGLQGTILSSASSTASDPIEINIICQIKLGLLLISDSDVHLFDAFKQLFGKSL